MVELLRSEVEVRGLAHITSGGTGNLLRLAAEVGYEIDAPLPVPPIFALIQEHGEVSEAEMYDVFNMGCGFCVVVPASDEAAALELLRAHYPAAKRIGRAAVERSRAKFRRLLRLPRFVLTAANRGSILRETAQRRGCERPFPGPGRRGQGNSEPVLTPCARIS